MSPLLPSRQSMVEHEYAVGCLNLLGIMCGCSTKYSDFLSPLLRETWADSPVGLAGAAPAKPRVATGANRMGNRRLPVRVMAPPCASAGERDEGANPRSPVHAWLIGRSRDAAGTQVVQFAGVSGRWCGGRGRRALHGRRGWRRLRRMAGRGKPAGRHPSRTPGAAGARLERAAMRWGWACRDGSWGTKLKPRWDVHLSGDDHQLGCAGESLWSVLGECPGSVV